MHISWCIKQYMLKQTNLSGLILRRSLYRDLVNSCKGFSPRDSQVRISYGNPCLHEFFVGDWRDPWGCVQVMSFGKVLERYYSSAHIISVGKHKISSLDQSMRSCIVHAKDGQNGGHVKLLGWIQWPTKNVGSSGIDTYQFLQFGWSIGVAPHGHFNWKEWWCHSHWISNEAGFRTKA